MEPDREADRPRVDVLVVTWNTAHLTAQALRRLLDTDQGAVTLRVLVHDNASSDGTPDVLATEVPEAEVVVGTDNLGFAGGVNLLLTRATAPWLLVLNSDAWPDPGAVGRLVETARQHPDAALVAPRLESPDGVLELSAFAAPSVTTAWAMALDAARWARGWSARRLLPGAWGHDVPRDVDWTVGAAWLLVREAVEAVGELDTSFFMYGEDVEYCLRLRRAGWRVLFEPRAIVRHLGNASGTQAYAGHTRAVAWVRNDLRLFRRHASRTTTAAYAIGHALGARRSARSARRRGEDGTADYWRTLSDAYLTGARSR